MKTKAKKSKTILIICNILLILAMITAAWIYSGYISKSQEEVKKAGFIRMVESMKTVSQNCFLTTKDEMNTMANIKGIPSVTVENEDLDVYKNILNPEKVEMKGVNEGDITWKIVESWYSDVNNYVAGEYETDEEALEAFAEMCGQ